MRYKEDMAEALDRLTALWDGRPADRPCIAVTAPNGKRIDTPAPADAETRWMDPAWVVPNILAQIGQTWWGGEAIPSALLMGGWVVCLGGKPRFEMNTIWFETVSVDFEKPSPFVHNPAGEWPLRFEALYTALAAAAGRNDFLVGQPCILPANDLLSMHMGTESFLIALIDHPEWMRRAISEGARSLLAAKTRYQSLIKDRHDFWYGSGGWMPMWAPRPYLATQSDVSCMLSPEMYDTFVVPELDVCGGEHGALWYHLDGGDARQHLPRLLSLPYVKVVQYTPAPSEPPNGPAHMEFYKKIQNSGRIVHIELPKENVEALVRELDPGKLAMKTHCRTPDEGKELLASAVRWTRARRS